MEHISPRIHEEIEDYEARYWALTVRQWLCIVVFAIVIIPSYMNLRSVLGEEITSYIIMAESTPIGFFGWVKIQGMHAEKVIPYWFRNYFKFAKPLTYKTEIELQLEKEAKIQKRKDTIKKYTKYFKINNKKKQIEKMEANYEEEICEDKSSHDQTDRTNEETVKS